MKRTLLVLSLLLTTLLTQAQMSDIQVMQYVQREMKSGSSQSQIATKLMQKGVTMQQLQRVRSQYEKLNGTSAVRSSGSTTDQLTADSRMRESNGAVRVDAEGNELYVQKVGSSNTDEDMLENSTLSDRQKVYIPDSVNTINGKRVFGRDIFNKKALSFEPNMNIATPTSYIVGPGDKVFVDVYGAGIRKCIGHIPGTISMSIDTMEIVPLQCVNSPFCKGFVVFQRDLQIMLIDCSCLLATC